MKDKKPWENKKETKVLECFYCHKKGHIKPKCRKWLAEKGQNKKLEKNV